MSANIKPIKKVLILRFSSIGDIVLTSPVLRCLSRQKNIEIHYFLNEKFQDLVLHNPYISKVYTFKKKPKERINDLKAEDYDFVIDLHKNIRTRLLKLMLRKRSFSFPKLNVRKWLLVNFKVDLMPEVHIVDRYFDAVKKLGVFNDGEGLDFFIGEKDRVNLKDLGLFEGKYIAIGIGAAHQTKSMPREKLSQLLHGLTDKIVLLGGRNEMSLGESLSDENVLNLSGKLSIGQTAAIIAKAKLLISPDTGIMHIGAALKKRVITVWGNTVPSFGMGPYYGNQEIQNYKSEVLNLSCRPCSKIGYGQCPKGHFKCMIEQDLDNIYQAIDKLNS